MIPQEQHLECYYEIDQSMPNVRMSADILGGDVLARLRSDDYAYFNLTTPLTERGDLTKGTMRIVEPKEGRLVLEFTGSKRWQKYAKRYEVVALIPQLEGPITDDTEMFSLQHIDFDLGAGSRSQSSGGDEGCTCGPVVEPGMVSASTDLDVFERVLNVKLDDPDDFAGELKWKSLLISWQREDHYTVTFFVMNGSFSDIELLVDAIGNAHTEP